MYSDRRTFIQRSSLVTAGLLGTAGTTNTAGAVSQSEESGRVTYGGSGVESVMVAFDDGHDVQTERNGRYERDLEPGTYAVTIDGRGYAEESTEVEVAAGETVTADFDLERVLGPDEGELVVAVVEDGGSTLESRVTVYGNGEEHSVTALNGRVPDDDRWTRGFVVSEGW